MKWFKNIFKDIDSLVGDGYISVSLLYAVFAPANLFAPALVKAIGHKLALVSYHQSYWNTVISRDVKTLILVWFIAGIFTLCCHVPSAFSS